MIAVVTGASRGVGKGIALALGEAGYTVYVTGRSSRPDPTLGGSITETAEAVSRAGGRGVAVTVDHADDHQVAALFDHIARDEGRLDLLVNNAAKVAGPQEGGFWEKPLEAVDLLTVGLRSHYIASWHAAPLMIANGRGLIVNTGHYGAVCYWQGPAYGAQKAGGDKMAADMARELRPHGVAAVSLWLGSVDTERSRAYRDARGAAASATLESPAFAGRVIAALYASDRLTALSGRALIAAELAALLGVIDADGTRPPSRRYTLGGPPEPHVSLIG